MRIIRATVLAIIASLGLLGSTTSIANATPEPSRAALFADGAGSAEADPGDPGLPPDN